MKRYLSFYCFLLTFLLLFSGCKKMLDVDSTRSVKEENMWNSLEDTRAALIGVYGLTKAALNDHNAYWLYGEVRSGDYESPNRQDLKAIMNHDLKANYESLNALSNWRRWFAIVNAANLFLERAPDVREKDKRYTENNLVVDIAQIRFLRAYAYYNMVLIWGDVPLITSSHDGSFENQEKEDKLKLYAWIEKEMFEAAQDLPYSYSTGDEQQIGNYYNEGSGRWQGALARKLSAYALLTHLAAWQGNYADAAAYSQFVMTNYNKAGSFYISTSALTDGNGFFFEKRPEHIFGFSYIWSHVEASFTGHIEELTLAAPVVNKTTPDLYMTKENILKTFIEKKDQRFSIDTLGNPNTEVYFRNFNGKYPIFSKIKCIQGGSSDPSFRIFTSATVLTRLEDIALLRAEALAVLGETNNAIDLLNEIRGRRGLKNYSETANGDLVDAIFLERKRELMGEGHRWYDMIRREKIKHDNPKLAQLIENDGIYWPIAKDVLDQNKLITQNAYWK
ncbi:RagB/SusD family nutrient uptake outer membrane protein [Sphingobacterium faecium]|uniref:RagB/SusD family nutrient uptake outer membrane protein n=1 Tax=Sphingobacterium faecium TaxID=34087 RepID=UPI0024685FE2|nr:RagB/SusD family nutrient uptake outer membrane protein [Sphingobacterium faecium]MDH5828825.1 RagB/SusD family nutrient uptake outer membrane protein [Sphingobacterium faecium]